MIKFKEFITEANMELEDVKVDAYYKAKSSKKNILWMVWAIDEDSVALMRNSNGTGKRVPIEKFLKSWIKVK